MAFAGTFGAAANQIPFGILASKQYGAASGYDADGRIQFTTPGGTVITPDRFDDLFITATGDILLALVNNDDDGVPADNGLIVSGAPAANQHGLPTNFGPGRGNWVANDLGSLKVEFRGAINTVGAVTNTGGPVLRGATLAGADAVISIKNMSEVVLASATIRVQMEHSIQA